MGYLADALVLHMEWHRTSLQLSENRPAGRTSSLTYSAYIVSSASHCSPGPMRLMSTPDKNSPVAGIVLLLCIHSYQTVEQGACMAAILEACHVSDE